MLQVETSKVMLRGSHDIVLFVTCIIFKRCFLIVHTLQTQSNWPFLDLLWLSPSMLHLIFGLLQGLALKTLDFFWHRIYARLHQSLVCVTEIYVVGIIEVILIKGRLLLIVVALNHFWLPISLVESVGNLDVLCTSRDSSWEGNTLRGFIHLGSILHGSLGVQNIDLLLVPHLLEVLHPIGCHQRLFEQVVSPLDLSVDCFSSFETARWFTGNKHSRYLDLHDWKLAQALIQASYDGHGWLELLFRGFRLADFKECLVIHHVIKHSE